MAAGLEELLGVLQKSGIPLPSIIGGTGDAASMQDNAPGAAQKIAGVVQGQDKVIPGLKSSYHDQLSKIAEMDQHLHSIYNDPTSPLHLNDPGKALSLESRARSTGFQAANVIKGAEKSQQSALDKQVSDATDLYSKLTTLQSREEARAAKAAKGGGGRKTVSQKVADSQQRASEARDQKMKLAGLSDPDAVAAFDNTKPGYQAWYFKSIQDAQNNGGGDIPPGGFSSQDVADSYNWWQKNVAPQKKATTSIFSKGGNSNSGNTNYFP